MKLKFKFLGPNTQIRNYSSFSLKTGIQCRLVTNTHWGLNVQKEAFLTPHGSNLWHLINSHLRGRLQAISVRWQHISPRRRRHLCHAPRAHRWLHLLKPPHGEQSAGLRLPPRPQHRTGLRQPPKRLEKTTGSMEVVSLLPRPSLGLGLGQNDSGTLLI